MMTFELESEGKMTSGNPRKERHGKEDGVLALDLDFACEVEAEILDQLALGDEFDWGSLYDKDGQVKNIGLKHIAFGREFEEHELLIEIGDRTFEFRDALIKKFRAEPIFGNRIMLKFQAQLHPDEADVGPVLEGLVNGCRVTVGPGETEPADDG